MTETERRRLPARVMLARTAAFVGEFGLPWVLLAGAPAVVCFLAMLLDLQLSD